MRKPLRTAVSACAGISLAGLLALVVWTWTGRAGAPARGEVAPSDEPKADSKSKHTNRLAKETSPYLLLHANNPVDWYPWGPEAFAKAKAEKKPIFLSVGYSSCYWCHVMERECFENEEIARILNEHFVCVKVDREERPDVDQVYMTALQAFGNGGGWPMSMFLTSDGRPFFGATYLPPKDQEGREGLPSLLQRVIEAWRDHRADLDKDADKVSELVRQASTRAKDRRKMPLSPAQAAEGRLQLAAQFDPAHGGFGYDPANPHRPKFPEPTNLLFLLDQHKRQGQNPNRPPTLAGLVAQRQGLEPLAMVVKTLDHMARGGIRDHLAGGYHRYSTDRSWTVPHFEKMLYDNALLATALVLAYEATSDERWKHEAEATLAFVARTFTAPEGAFYSALDAETDGEEGQYYVWTREEVKRILGDGDRIFARVYGLDRAPNFGGNRFVLFEPLPRAELAEALQLTPETLEARLAPLRARLLAEREKRAAPLRDDKVLTAWNGLMIAAYAEADRVLKLPGARKTAETAADFLLTKLRDSDRRLLRTYRAGQAKVSAYLEDYAYLAYGLLRLHAATGDARRLDQARNLTDRMIHDFADKEEGGFFFTADDHESLLARPKDPVDSALPSANAVAIRNLIALSAATGEPRYLELAGQSLRAFSATIAEMPSALPTMLVALEEYFDARPEAQQPPVADAPTENLEAPAVLSAKTSVREDAGARSGGEIDIVLTLTIKEGWHIYANPARPETVKPTSVALLSATGDVLEQVRYPAGRLRALASSGQEQAAVYEGNVEVVAHVKLGPRVKPGAHSLRFVVNYQACNDRVCLAPAKLTVMGSVTIK